MPTLRMFRLTILLLSILFLIDANSDQPNDDFQRFDHFTGEDVKVSYYALKRKLRSIISETEDKVRHYFQIGDDRHPEGKWDATLFRNKRETLKRVRRWFTVRCCGSQSCLGPETRPNANLAKHPNRNLTRPGRRKVNYQVLGYDPINNKLFIKKNKRPNSINSAHKAVAKIVRGGISISCPNCPENWQNELRLGKRAGTIPIVCPGCASNWRDFLPDEFKMQETTTAEATTTTSGDDEESEVDEFGDEVEIVTEIIEEGAESEPTTLEEGAVSEEDATTEEEVTSEEVTTDTPTEATTTEITTVTTKAVVTTTTQAPATTLTTTSAATTAKSALALPAGMSLPPGLSLPANLPGGLGGLAALLG